MLGDRVKESTTTTGVGDITVAGAATGHITFNTKFGIGVRFRYAVASPSGSEWEVGDGYLSNSTTLVRDVVFFSSNSGALVNFSAGTKDVFCTIFSGDVFGKGRTAAMNTKLTLGY